MTSLRPWSRGRAAAGDDGGRGVDERGYLITPTFVKRSEEEARKDAPIVIKPETSEAMRYLMRLNARRARPRKSISPAISSAARPARGEGDPRPLFQERLFTTFMAVAPSDKPKYLFMTLMDERRACPKPAVTPPPPTTRVWSRENHRARRPLLGLAPRFEAPKEPFPILARMGYGFVNVPATGGGGH